MASFNLWLSKYHAFILFSFSMLFTSSSLFALLASCFNGREIKYENTPMSMKVSNAMGSVLANTSMINVSRDASVALMGRWATTPQFELITGENPASIFTPLLFTTTACPASPVITALITLLLATLVPIRSLSG